MSTDIYIPLSIVLSHPGQFKLKAELNGSVEMAAEAVAEDDIDWWHVESLMQPVLMCKFGARESWRVVEVFDHDLHVSVGGSFRDWLTDWLDDHAYSYTNHFGD